MADRDLIIIYNVAEEIITHIPDKLSGSMSFSSISMNYTIIYTHEKLFPVVVIRGLSFREVHWKRLGLRM